MVTKEYFAFAAVCALAFGAIVGSPPQVSPQTTGGESAHYAGATDVEANDSVVVADEIAERLGAENSAAFGIEVTVEHGQGSDSQLVLASAVTASDDPQPDVTLEPDAEDAIDATGGELSIESEAVAASGIDVTRVQVSVAGASSAPGADGSRVTMLIDTVRSMAGLPDWEESTYYVADVSPEGSVVSLEEHDEFWYQQHPEDVASDLAQVAMPTPEVDAAPAALTSSGKAAAVAYANQYWSSYNPQYLTSPNDCTNFISQALYRGGWVKKGTDSSGANRAKNTVWWYTGTGLYPKSYSWADAQVWREFAQGQSRVASIGTNLARSGDVIQYDIGLNGMNHTTIVTFYDTDSGQPLLTYHTSNTHNKPLSAFQASVASEAHGQDYRLYAWRT